MQVDTFWKYAKKTAKIDQMRKVQRQIESRGDEEELGGGGGRRTRRKRIKENAVAC